MQRENSCLDQPYARGISRLVMTCQELSVYLRLLGTISGLGLGEIHVR